MDIQLKDGAMVALAAIGIIFLAATAEFGLPALIIGAGLSSVSGALAVTTDTQKSHREKKVSN